MAFLQGGKGDQQVIKAVINKTMTIKKKKLRRNNNNKNPESMTVKMAKESVLCF